MPLTQAARRHLRLHPRHRPSRRRRTPVATSSPPPSAKSATASSAAFPGDDPESSGGRLPRRQPQRNALLRGLPHRAAQVRPHRSHDRRRHADLHQHHARRSTAARSATCPTTSTRSTWASCWRRRTTTTVACCSTKSLFPQDIRNCTKCHDGSATSTAQTTQGDNWKNVPNRLACGACHDGINFATGMGVTIADAHEGADLTTTTTASAASRTAAWRRPTTRSARLPHAGRGIDVVHLPVTPPNADNALDVALADRTAPATATPTRPGSPRTRRGCRPARSRSPTTSRASRAMRSKQPVMVFRMLQNGVAVTFKTFDPTLDPTRSRTRRRRRSGTTSWVRRACTSSSRCRRTASRRRPTSTRGRRGYLRSIWNGTRHAAPGPGTLTGPDANGYYTVTLTGVTIPDNAVMLTGGLGYLVQREEHAAADADQPGELPGHARHCRSPRWCRCRRCSRTRSAHAQQARRPDRHRAQRAEGGHRVHRPPSRSSRTRAATTATRNSAPSPTTRSTPASATTARPARGATRRTAPAAAGRRTPPASSTRSTRARSATVPFTWHAVEPRPRSSPTSSSRAS